MVPILKIFLLLLIGALGGFISAQRSVDGRGEALANSAWRSWQGKEPDPYSLAHYLDGGMLPPDAPQWTLYETEKDSSGARLDGDCIYNMIGRMPAGRWWRLSAEGGGPPGATAHRSWLQSDSAIVEADGTIGISLSPSPRPANWIMPPDISDLRLLLFVLEADKGATATPPEINRISCP